MSDTKPFALRTVFSVTTGLLLTKAEGPRDNGIGDMYKLLEWMTGEAPFTHQLPRFAEECRPFLIERFPALFDVMREVVQAVRELTEGDDKPRAVDRIMEKAEASYGHSMLDVPKLPRGQHRRAPPAYGTLVDVRRVGARGGKGWVTKNDDQKAPNTRSQV